MKWPSPPQHNTVPLGGGYLQQMIKFTHMCQPRVTVRCPHVFFFRNVISLTITVTASFIIKDTTQNAVPLRKNKQKKHEKRPQTLVGTASHSSHQPDSTVRKGGVEVQVLQHQQPLGGPQSLEGDDRWDPPFWCHRCFGGRGWRFFFSIFSQ